MDFDMDFDETADIDYPSDIPSASEDEDIDMDTDYPSDSPAASEDEDIDMGTNYPSDNPSASEAGSSSQYYEYGAPYLGDDPSEDPDVWRADPEWDDVDEELFRKLCEAKGPGAPSSCENSTAIGKDKTKDQLKSVSRSRPKVKWSIEEDMILAQGLIDNLRYKSMALNLPGRTREACESHTQLLRLSRLRSAPPNVQKHILARLRDPPKRKPKPWSTWEDVILIQMYLAGHTYTEIWRALGRTKAAIGSRLMVLRKLNTSILELLHSERSYSQPQLV
ncbi:hypothetical protein BDV95DRAFT_110838 [Massariosphaeria phaeospora]|uniref:Myb-like domain-containing protein n=1 Tax=Massariosphaeria phaeospora TaxID=100035 RepID=A0A7C8M5L9_9PLEO|nr:hypothetical protein BDV95DRAFT_110838 [Massariosphaeria phaeospora]